MSENKANQVLIVFVVDTSGSMDRIDALDQI